LYHSGSSSSGEFLFLDLDASDPIFILGILPRSGTNYLWDLLCLHPACAPARSPVREDLFLENSDHLVDFVGAVQAAWDPRWGQFPDDLGEQLHHALGEGLLSFLREDGARRLLTKSPSVHHIDRFFTFFPRGRLLILVRDGRSVTQSCMATFGWDFERAARSWATAADEIHRFASVHQGEDGRYLIIRYEDLIDDLRGSLVSILRFLELDENDFDFGAAADLPVRGSSAYFGPRHESVHWNPVPRNSEFDPRERWRSWTPQMHERFAWIAGEQLRHFGYGDLAERPRTPFWIGRHRVRDLRWRSRVVGRRVTYQLRVRLGSTTRPLRERLGLVRSRG
jgi:protein-tyrosine sulfotransferase